MFVETIEELANDDWIKAVVLRIDSPGGSALTSELLWRAIEKLKESKPVIVSMGNTAASGGYYIAAGADHIFADPLTITGSIGVFATLPNAKGFLDDIGIQSESVETHPNAIGYSPYQNLSESYEKQMKRGIESVYDTFKQRVIDGRNLSSKEVERLSQGRVWSGKQALDIGLIDDLGGLKDAIELAAKISEIENYNVIEYPKFEENLENMLSGITPSIHKKNRLENLLPEQILLILKGPQANLTLPYIQTLLPFELSIN